MIRPLRDLDCLSGEPLALLEVTYSREGLRSHAAPPGLCVGVFGNRQAAGVHRSVASNASS